MKLLYNIYEEYLSDDELIALAERVQKVNEQMKPLLEASGFHKHYNEDGRLSIHISYGKVEIPFHGNIGFNFDNQKDISFTFYITKSYKDSFNDYFRRLHLAENISIDYLETHWKILLDQALNAYNQWNAKDIIEEGELIK